MSKLESLCPIVLDLSKASREERYEVLQMCNVSGYVRWCGGQGLFDDGSIESLLRGSCLKLSCEGEGSDDRQEGFTCTYASITFYEENPNYYNQIVGPEYFKFLLEDHLYEKQG